MEDDDAVPLAPTTPTKLLLDRAGGIIFIEQYYSIFKEENITPDILADESTHLQDILELGIIKRKGDALRLRNAAISWKQQKIHHASSRSTRSSSTSDDGQLATAATHHQEIYRERQQQQQPPPVVTPVPPSVTQQQLLLVREASISNVPSAPPQPASLSLLMRSQNNAGRSFPFHNPSAMHPSTMIPYHASPSGSSSSLVDNNNPTPSLGASLLRPTGNSSTNASFFDPIPQQLVENIHALYTQSRHASTLETYVKGVKWFEDMFGRRLCEVSPSQALNLMEQYVSSSSSCPIRASTKLRYVNSIFAVLDMVGVQTGHVDPYKKKLASILREREKKDRSSGRACRFVVLTYKDNRHVLHCILQAHSGRIPFWYLFRMLLIVLGQNSGRRTGELMMIAAAEWTFKISEQGLRSMTMTYCYRKRDGIGIYTQKLLEPETGTNVHDDGPPSNFVLFVLAYFQVVGMIDSAIDVYTGRRPLLIDRARWETANDLCTKLKRAEAAAKTENIQTLKAKMNAGGTVDAQDENEAGCLPRSILSKLEDEDKQCIKLPFFVSYDQKTKRLSAKRFNFRGLRPVNEVLSEAGYAPSQELKAGCTGTRKFFRQNHRSETVAGFDIQSHMLLHQSHTHSVALERYENANDYSRSMAANISQPTVGPDRARAEIAQFAIQPAFYLDGFFRAEVEIRRAPLPWEAVPTIFFPLATTSTSRAPPQPQPLSMLPAPPSLAKLVARALPQPMAAVAHIISEPILSLCPGQDCQRRFHFEEELCQHMKSECQYFRCDTCRSNSRSNRKYKLLTNLQEHKRRCPGLAQQRQAEDQWRLKRLSLDFMRLFTCSKCSNAFPSQAKLNKHEATHRKNTTTSNRSDGNEKDPTNVAILKHGL
jgi:hypothetical protein